MTNPEPPMIQEHDFVAREFRPGEFRIQEKSGGRLVTIDDGPYTSERAARIAMQKARDGGGDAFRLTLNGLVEVLEAM